MLLKQRGNDSINNIVLKKQERKGERVEEGGEKYTYYREEEKEGEERERLKEEGRERL